MTLLRPPVHNGVLREIAEHKKKPKAATLDFSCQEMSPEYLVITYAQSYYTMDSPSWQQLIAMKGGMPMSKKLIAPKGKRYIFRPWTTINGKVVYAWQYGIKAFPILVDDN